MWNFIAGNYFSIKFAQCKGIGGVAMPGEH
jgi:hypothetical protein